MCFKAIYQIFWPTCVNLKFFYNPVVKSFSLSDRIAKICDYFPIIPKLSSSRSCWCLFKTLISQLLPRIIRFLEARVVKRLDFITNLFEDYLDTAFTHTFTLVFSIFLLFQEFPELITSFSCDSFVILNPQTNRCILELTRGFH